MKPLLQALAIDDHIVVVEGYRYLFKSLEGIYENMDFSKASDCLSAHELITTTTKTFDIAVIDYSIPPCPEKGLFSGKDVAILLRKQMPQCMIIMMTMHKESEIIDTILHKIKPNGFINKSDCTTDELVEGFKQVLAGHTFYSKTIKGHVERKEKGIILEDVDIRIILLLAKGIKNKNLSEYIPLSNSAIERRKQNIKRLLNIKGNDDDLIATAREHGYI